MENSKLIEVLKTLSKTEFKEFGKYLEGTSYRKTGPVFMLYQYLKKFHPKYPAEKIRKEIVYKTLFKHKGNINKKVFDLMYNLYHVLEDFLIKKELEKTQVERDFIILDILKHRKLDKLFFQKIGAIQKDWEKKPPIGIEQMHNEYKLAKRCVSHPTYSLFSNQEIAPDNLNLIEKIDNYYFVVKLFYTLCSKQNQIFLNQKSEKKNHLIEPILDLGISEEFEDIPQIVLLTNMIKAYQTNNFTDYPQYKKYFFDFFNLYNDSETKDIVTFLQQSLYENHRNGIPNSLNEMFHLFQFGFEHKIFIEGGFVNDSIFKNVVFIACVIGELDWCDQFIKEYAMYLKENIRKDIVQLCKAMVAFNRNDFEATLEHLVFVKLQDAVYATQVKCLQLQCYYELEDYEELFYNMIRSFSTFVKRNKNLAEPFKKAWLNFIKYTNKLYSLKLQKGIDNTSLLQEISKTPNINSKSWLLKKGGELIKKPINS